MHMEIRELDTVAMGKRIRAIRDARKMTREVLAEKVDVSVNFISDIEYGKKCPSIRNFYLICQALDITADYILSGNFYANDFDEDAIKTCEEIMELITGFSKKQLKSIRDISMIYVDNLKK